MADPDKAREGSDGAQSVRRAMAVLRLVAAGQDQGVRLTDVATLAGLTLPTARRLLKVLMEETAVEQDPTTRRYRIGNEITLLGLARPGGFSLRSVAEPYLASLAAHMGDTVFLSVRHGADSVCIARYLGSHPIQVLSIPIGARRPMGASVSGIMLLSGMNDRDVASITSDNRMRLQALGRSVKSVTDDVAAARRSGYVYAPRGVMSGTSAIAVAVPDANGQVVGAISIATLASRLGRDRVRSLVDAMQTEVARLTARLREIEQARAVGRRQT
ncbi:MAG: IclR family transcriptional regulator [Burkholderiaceae bacterium]